MQKEFIQLAELYGRRTALSLPFYFFSYANTYSCTTAPSFTKHRLLLLTINVYCVVKAFSK